MPVTRKRKIEVARLAGFGLVLAGMFALFLAVVSSQEAGAGKPTPPANQLHCSQTGNTTDDWLGDAVQYGACQTTTSSATEASTTYVTTTTKKSCGCSHPTTTYVTTTTQHHCGCSTTSTEATTSTTTLDTLPATTVATTTSTTPTSGSLPVSSTSGGTPTTEDTTPYTGSGGSPTIVTAGGPTGGGGSPVSQAEAVSGQLPFTGSSGLPLAGFGLLMVATGLALALRRHRFAR